MSKLKYTPVVMRYKHRYTIYAAHLTNTEAHDNLILARVAKNTENLKQLYEQVIANTHGHNFEIVVIVEYDTAQIQTHADDLKLMVADYQQIERIIKDYHRVNLTTHHKFKGGYHVTLDRLALQIWQDIKKLYPDQMISVSIYGSPKQSAEVVG